MFAPMSPMGERLRFQNEAQELARHSAQRTRWNGTRQPLAIVRRVLASLNGVTQTQTRPTSSPPRLVDCPEIGQEC